MADDELATEEAGKTLPSLSPLRASDQPTAGDFDEGIDVPKLEELLKDYIFSQSIGTLNPPKFGKVLAAKIRREGKEHLCVLYTVESSGPADRRPYEAAFGEPEVFEEVVYITDYMSISTAPPR
ncbi:unnamed protein product [Symbiodinium pilosum]|uniref:Uncharacterized protein n=1 Tax=Symbiodinium pilosum TaxID=2952 RepID=A0A812XKJ5_SYMPI|nr:unnamed protein product [Symbiodinium pilosum]